MSQLPGGPPPPDPDPTSDRLYSTSELDAFALHQLTARRNGKHVDPLTDPIPRAPRVSRPGTPDRAAAPATGQGGQATSRPSMTTPAATRATALPSTVELPVVAAPARTPRPAAAPPTLGPRPTAPPRALGPRPTAPPAGLGPRPTAPPPAPRSGLGPRPTAPPPAPRSGLGPRPTAPPAAEGTTPRGAGSRSAARRGGVTATEFLDRRAPGAGPGAATWGWRGRLRRWSGGRLPLPMGAAEVAHEADRTRVQAEFDGPRTIAFVNPKGGAAKTTGVLAAGYTFGTVRGGGVVAWDNNETRGTLGMRGSRSAHRNTTRELLDHVGWFRDAGHSRIGDLGSFVRSQGDAHFDVLASDERADVTGVIRAADFREVHDLLSRFYRMILVDTGNNLRAENWLAAAEYADLLVVTSTVREDTGYSGLWMLDALEDAGYHNLRDRTITVLSDPSPRVDKALARDMVSVYEQRTRAVYRVPYDPVLVSGSAVPYGQLSTATRRAWLRACAGMAAAL